MFAGYRKWDMIPELAISELLFNLAAVQSVAAKLVKNVVDSNILHKGPECFTERTQMDILFNHSTLKYLFTGIGEIKPVPDHPLHGSFSFHVNFSPIGLSAGTQGTSCSQE